jgi:DNA modification methylase
MGDHILLCGDATKKEDVEKLMGTEKADLIFTDPPYGVNYAAKNVYLNKVSKGNRIIKPIENDNKTETETYEFYKSACSNMNMIGKPGCSFYICSAPGTSQLSILTAIKDSGLQVRQFLVWLKNHFAFGKSDYQSKYELILYGWLKGTHKWYGGRGKTNVWEFDRVQKSNLHPTMKPVELIIEAIENSSQRNEIVFDAFGGSGSTLIACEKTNRKCRMIEIDPLYCQIIVNRWETLTGKKAQKKI